MNTYRKSMMGAVAIFLPHERHTHTSRGHERAFSSFSASERQPYATLPVSFASPLAIRLGFCVHRRRRGRGREAERIGIGNEPKLDSVAREWDIRKGRGGTPWRSPDPVFPPFSKKGARSHLRRISISISRDERAQSRRVGVRLLLVWVLHGGGGRGGSGAGSRCAGSRQPPVPEAPEAAGVGPDAAG